MGLVQPMIMYLVISNNCMLAWLAEFLSNTLSYYSGLTTYLIAFVRYLRLRKTVSHVKTININVVNIMITFNTVFSVILSSGYVISSVYRIRCYSDLFYVSSGAFLTTTFCAFYMMTMRNVKSQILSVKYVNTKKNHENVDSVTLHQNKYNATMTKSIGCLIAFCCISYTPFYIISVLVSYRSLQSSCITDNSSPHNFPLACNYLLIYLNSSVNVLLYSYNKRLKNV